MWKKILGYTLLALATIAGAGFSYLYFREPASQPPANIHVAATPERIARGRYLYALADCDGCHSPHDTSKLYLPVVEARRGSGQRMEEEGMPFDLYASNITPDEQTGIGAWTDGEKIRAIREGIGRDGRVLFPMMPYEYFRHMSDEDVQSLVAYLNTLKPVRNEVPRSKPPLMISMMIKSSPRPVTRQVSTPPPRSPAYGEYLVTMGLCQACHTPGEGPHFDLTRRFAGGRRFNVAGYSVVSANITPDKDTGIGNWTLDYFLERFRRHRGVSEEALPAATPELFTLMPWRSLSTMTDEDLGAIYGYLMSRPAVAQKVDTHPVQVASRE